MNHTALELIELGAVFFGLGLLGRLAGRIGLSPIPLYLIGGLCFGSGGLVPLGDIGDFTSIAGEVGVVLLLLLLGLEYSAAELITGLRRSWTAGLLDIALNAAPGVAVALILGWGPVGAMVMAGVTYISSSGIVAKVLSDLGRLGNRETPVILSILVFEDLAMAVYLPILTALLIGVSFFGGLEAVAISLVVVSVVLVVALRYGRYVSMVVDSPDREVFLLKVLGAALLVAGFASALQVSAAVGAFLLGIAISGSTAENATKLLEPLRDLFAAVFFVVFGLNTDPRTIPPVLVWAVVLAVATTVTKPGVAKLRHLLDRRTFRLTKEELERRFLPLARKTGLPVPLTGQWVNEFEVDFYWPALGLVIETDGLRYHRTPAEQARDRLRDQAHTAAGLTPLRFTHEQVRYEPEYVREILAQTASRLAISTK